MKIVIDGTTYTKIKNLSFAPETDIVDNELPINRFSVSIFTRNAIDTGKFAYLYDESNTLWAKYWVVNADRKSDSQVDLVAESIITLLKRREMPPKMYSNEPLANIMADIFDTVETLYPNSYEIDSSFANATITGYAAHHSARYRLQIVCFCIGAYVKSYFNDKIQILPIDDTPVYVPMGKTFWKPEISYDDYVTLVRANAYTYTQGTPQSGDEYVEVDGVTYIQTVQEFSLQNPVIPITAVPKDIFFEDLTLINQSNVSSILTRVSTYYFQRARLKADIVNNAEYYPAERIGVLTDSDDIVRGYIKSCSFTFGLQAKATVELVQTDTIIGELLTIYYLYGRMRLGREKYKFPVDYVYQIQNPYLDISTDYDRTIYRPLTQYATGTMIAGGVDDEEFYDIALVYAGGILNILSVDEVSQSGNIVEVS